METIISVTELKHQMNHSDWMIFDCRYSLTDESAGRTAYEQSHLPGALYVDMGKQLSAPHIPGVTGRHPLPEKKHWIAQVQSWGIEPAKQLVLYDDAGGAFAARMWWMLRWIGHGRVAVLDGGWLAWNEESFPISDQLAEVEKATNTDYGALPELTRQINADEINAEKQLLLDARELPRFKGEVEPLDPIAGHIPGAICSAFSANLDESGSFRSKEELREKFKPAIESDRDIICYCGSGVTAAHNILAMTHAGIEEAFLYAGSWSEWITDPSREIATGE